MHEFSIAQVETRSKWHMPLSSEQYDRGVVLSKQEREALIEVASHPYLFRGHQLAAIFTRLTHPLQDAYELKLVQKTGGKYNAYLRVMYYHMIRTDKSFWGWSQDEWVVALLASNPAPYIELSGVRFTMRVVAYLFCGFLITSQRFSPFLLACIVFGEELVQEQYEKVACIIFGKDGFGYVRSKGQEEHLMSAVMFALLANQNPYLEALTIESLHAARLLACSREQTVEALDRVTRALEYLKIVRLDTFSHRSGNTIPSSPWAYTCTDVDPRWLAWVQVYITQAHGLSDDYRKTTFHYLLIAGRWLKKYHPTVIDPDQWDEPLAHEYVTWVCTAKRGELVSRDVWLHAHPCGTPIPLHAPSIDGRLGALRRFFKALQKKPYQIGEHLAQRLMFEWDPEETLRTPETIKRQLMPNPRNLEQAWWQKLTWAAASLSAKDLSAARSGMYPLAYYRAVGLLWVTGARRSDEIRRLKTGCVSREWVPEMYDEEGHQLESEEHFAYLRVPVNKMQGEFWIPIPIYTADAIEVWERLRPQLQDSRVDRKEKKPTDYLFMTRNQTMGENFLNRSLIPLLCKVAGLVDEQGVPLRDTVGRITSHRARSTLATWLQSNGLSLTYIAKLLGHTDLKSLPWYLREDKHQFARVIRKHNPLERMVTAILDTETLKRGTGEPAVFYYLSSGSDGRSSLCASPDYGICVHQMQCKKCEMYVEAEQAEIIARRPGVLTIEVHIPTPPHVADLLDQEEALGTKIIEHLPPPLVPSLAYHFNQQIPSRDSDPVLQHMKNELEALTTEWAEKAGKFDMRSAGMKSLKKHITDLAAKIEVQEAGLA